MGNNNEAKIKVSADISELKNAVKDANSNLNGLRSELKLNEAQFQNTGDKTEYLESKHKILASMLEENKAKQEALNDQLMLAQQAEDTEQIDKLTNSLNYAQIQEENLKNQLESVDQELEYSNSVTGSLSDTIDEQTKKLEELKNKYVETAIEKGNDSEEAQKLGEQIRELSESLNSNKEKLESARASASDYERSLENVSTESENVSDKGTDSMNRLAEGIIAAGVADAVKDIGEAVIDTANQFDESAAIIAEGTGATGEALQKLSDVATDTYKNVKDSNASMADVSGVVAELNTRLGLTDDAAQKTSEKIMNFAKVTGSDAVVSVDNIVDVMKRWNIPASDMDKLLDDIVTGEQSCKLSADDLTGYLTKNSAQFQELGYSIDEAEAFLISISDSGGNVSSVMSGTTKAIANLSAVTNDVPSAFQDTITAISECDNVSEALQAQVGNTGLTVEDVFGKKAAQEIATCVQNGSMDIRKFQTALEENDGIMNQTKDDATTMADEYAQSTNNLKATLSENFLPTLKDVADVISNTINFCAEHKSVIIAITSVIGILTVALGLYSVAQAVGTAMQTASVTSLGALIAAKWSEVTANLAVAASGMAALAPYLLIVAAIAAVIAIIVLCVKHWDKIKETVSNVTNSINSKVAEMKEKVSEKIETVKEKMNTVVNWIKSNWQGLLLLIVNPFAGAFKLLYDNCENFKNTVNKIFSAIRNTISKILINIKSIFSSVFSSIMNKASSNFDGIRYAITHPIETAKKTLSKLLAGIKNLFSNLKISFPKIKVPHFKIYSGKAPWGIGGEGKKPTIDIDWYAKGAIFKKPTILNTSNGFKGVGESGAEAVAPISVLQDYVVNAVDYALPDKYFTIDYNQLAYAMAQMQSVIELDRREVGRVVRSM